MAYETLAELRDDPGYHQAVMADMELRSVIRGLAEKYDLDESEVRSDIENGEFPFLPIEP